MASLVPQMVKNPPAMEEAWVQSLGQEDPLEKGMATHSTILAWRVPWTEEPGGIQSMGLQESNMTATKPLPPQKRKDDTCLHQRAHKAGLLLSNAL